MQIDLSATCWSASTLLKTLKNLMSGTRYCRDSKKSSIELHRWLCLPQIQRGSRYYRFSLLFYGFQTFVVLKYHFEIKSLNFTRWISLKNLFSLAMCSRGLENCKHSVFLSIFIAVHIDILQWEIVSSNLLPSVSGRSHQWEQTTIINISSWRGGGLSDCGNSKRNDTFTVRNFNNL